MRKDKPIVFLCHPYHRGGVTRWMADMAIECAKNNREVFVVTVDPARPFFSAGKETFISLLQHNAIKIISAKVDWKFEFGTEAYRSMIYAGLLHRNVPVGADVILAEDPAVWAAAERLRGLYNFVGVLHSDEEHYYQLALQHSDLLSLCVCVSNRIRQKLLMRNTGIDEKLIITIPCGIPLPEFSRREDEGNRLEILYVGRVSQYQKRVFDIPMVCEALRKMGTDFQMTIIGSGDDLEELKNRVQTLELRDQIRFLGWLSKEEALEYLQGGDVLLLTSDFEGMPIAVMEALSCGCGVVATNVSGVEDYAENEFAQDCFWLYDTGDVQRAATFLAECHRVSKQIRAEQARKFAENEFSIQNCMNRYLAAMEYTQPISVRANPAAGLSGLDLFSSYWLSLSRYLRVSASRNVRALNEKN